MNELIQYLREKATSNITEYGMNPNAASWGDQDGVLISSKQALDIADALETKNEILKDILNEVCFARNKHPNWPADIIHAAGIVVEEAGELMRAALQIVYEGGDPKEAKKEAVQTACTCIRFLSALLHDKYTKLHENNI